MVKISYPHCDYANTYQMVTSGKSKLTKLLAKQRHQKYCYSSLKTARPWTRTANHRIVLIRYGCLVFLRPSRKFPNLPYSDFFSVLHRTTSSALTLCQTIHTPAEFFDFSALEPLAQFGAFHCRKASVIQRCWHCPSADDTVVM